MESINYIAKYLKFKGIILKSICKQKIIKTLELNRKCILDLIENKKHDVSLVFNLKN